MKTHYYLGWFNNFFPENLRMVLQEDITDRKSLAMISSNPSIYEDDGATERSWLDQAGIMFDEYHLINYRVQIIYIKKNKIDKKRAAFANWAF